MIKQIAITFGSNAILNNIYNKNSNRLAKFQPINNTGQMMLLDYSGEKSIFNSPVIYEVLDHSGVDSWDGFLNFTTFELNPDQQKLFDARIKHLLNDEFPKGMKSAYSLNYKNDTSKRVLASTWDTFQEFNNWKNNQDLVTANHYDNTPNFYYHESNYTKAKEQTA